MRAAWIRRWRAAGVGASVALAVLAPGVPGGAQATPSFSISTTRLAPGETATMTISDCTEFGTAIGVWLTERFQDTVQVVPFTETSPGTWEGTVTAGTNAGADDLTVAPTCNSWDGEPVIIDVDNPRLLPMPWTPPADLPDPPESFLGTDCPDGAEPDVRFLPDGIDIVYPASPATDAFGDWEVPVPGLAPGTTVTVEATCGDVTYPARTYVAGGSANTTTTTSALAAETPPPVAPPAAPRSASAAYTG